jgi:thioester reductase-like protein
MFFPPSPARIVFSAEAFTSENDMLTPSMKVKRGPIETRFHREIEEAAESAAALSGSNPSTSSGVLDESFLLQGGDSLSAVKLVSRIKRELGADVPASFLLQNPTLADLRAYVASSSALFVPTLPAAAVADLALDARQHLGPERGTSCSLLSEAKCVLLTGATGFLGAFLLRDLLAALPSATVICAAVRGGETRLREALKFRGIRIGQDDWKRVEVLAGDLASGLIGCEEPKQFAKLARRVDAVFHSAASVNWMRSYEALRNDNVAPCFDLIRFCTTAKLKRLVHISTVSCSPARLSRDGQEYFEGFGDDAWIANSGPYAQTKYVAEKIFLSCASEFPISIFRPANILADSVSGSANVTDFSNRLVACSVLLNAAISEAEVVSNFTPVDYVSSAIVRVASHPKVHLGPFLLTNNNSPSLAVIADAIVAEFPSVRRLSYLDFRRLLLEHPHPEQLPLFGLLPLFQSTRPFMQDSISWSDCTNTWALVEECPKTTAVHLKKWISFLRGQRVV